MPGLFAKNTKSTSILQTLDARTKLIITALTAVLVLVSGGVVGQGILFLVTLCYALLLKRPALLGLLYLMLLAMLMVATACAALLESWVAGLGALSIKALGIPFLRGASMMNVVMVLALTTRIEDLLSTLERLRIPFIIFLPAAVMLRFIPTFTHDIRQVWETLKIRGWPMGVAMLTFHPLLSARLLLVPILFRALKSSETLGIASELKGLGSVDRTALPTIGTFKRMDYAVLALSVATLMAVVLAEIYLKNAFMYGNATAIP